LIVRAPGVTTAGSRCAIPVSQVEILPTLGELCGIDLPPLDGRSLMPELRDDAARRDDAVFAEFNLQTPRAKYMIRRGDFKYTFRANGDVPELYDLRSDPAEMDNLALKTTEQGRVEKMKSDLFAWYRPPEIRQ
jgi:choline-sulfatase